MWATVRDVCTRPRATFERFGERPSLRGPVAVVYGQAVLALLTILVPALARYDDLVAGSPPLALTTATGTVAIPRLWVGYIVSGFVQPLLDWIGLSLLVALGGAAALVLAGRGLPATTGDAIPSGLADEDRWRADATAGSSDAGASADRPSRDRDSTLLDRLHRTVAFVGWGYLPMFPAYVFTGGIIVTYAVLGLPVADGYVTITAPRHPVAHATGLPLVVWSTHAVGALCTVWSGYVWYGAVGAAWGLSRRAALAVAAPITVGLIAVADVFHAFHVAV